MDKVRAKFWVKDKRHCHVGVPGRVFVEVKLAPCYSGYPGGDSAENKSFAEATPSGEITLGITNPAAIEFFNLDDVFYIDFSRAS